jgi:hypothetical protein
VVNEKPSSAIFAKSGGRVDALARVRGEAVSDTTGRNELAPVFERAVELVGGITEFDLGYGAEVPT